MPVDTVDTRRTVGLALMDLDAESFAFVVGQLWQLSKTAGGFRDQAGWEGVRVACEAFYPEFQDPRRG